MSRKKSSSARRWTGLVLGVFVSLAVAHPDVGPSVQEVVEFTRIIQPYASNNDAMRQQVSPDGTRAFIVTRKADVATDTNRYEIQLLDLRPDMLLTQRTPSPEVVFSKALSGDNNYADPAVQDVHWHGDRTLVFLARLDGKHQQVYRLDLATRELLQLTNEANPIVSYAASEDLRRVVYAAQMPNPPQREGAHDVVVGNQTLWSVKYGQQDQRAQQRKYRFFVVDAASPLAPRPLGAAFVEGNLTRPAVSISPDGRWALLPRYEAERLAGWARQYPLVDDAAKRFAVSSQLDPLGYFSNPLSYLSRRITAWRLDDGREQTIVDAPDDTLPGWSQLRQDRLWQGGGTSVILAGTHLPAVSDGKVPTASHVIEYWPDRGQWKDVAALQDRLQNVYPEQDGFVVLDGSKRRRFHHDAQGGWQESIGGEHAPAESGSAWTPHIDQGLNQPPDVYASGPGGRTTRLTQLNPQFDAGTWGVMAPYTWHDAAGRQWDGGLMSGSGMDAQARYPLLIQTYGFSPDHFYLDGPNTSDGATSGFVGRAVLRNGILVLAMPLNAKGVAAEPGGQPLKTFNDGVRGAVEALVEQGRVDPSRVGIIGWSATGERVLNLLAFGDVPIRAATMADADANTLFGLTLSYGAADAIWGRMEKYNGGPAFGDTTGNWVRNDPALHTDCIHTALRIESYGPWVLPNWDVYALLRRQYKPADMIVIPSGTHSLGLPVDRMLSLQGNVDWYAFWLAGRTRTSPLFASETANSVAAQFAQWRQMETLKIADDARPRCVR